MSKSLPQRGRQAWLGNNTTCVILMVQPGAGALAVAWMIAWYAIVFGCLHIALAFRLRQYKKA